MKQQELADLLGVSRTVVANYETGRSEPPRGVVAQLASAWRIPENWFWDGQDSPTPVQNVLAGVHPANRAEQINLVPYWGEVPCGEWAMPTSDPELIQISEAVDPRDIIAVRVVGNSMLPLFRHGQVVACRRVSSPIDGVVHLCHNEHGELTLKVTRYVRGEWELHSVNPDYPNVTAQKWTVLARAVHVEETDPAGIRP